MQNVDLAFLEPALQSFIETSIHRAAHSGDMQFRYRITAAEIKAATGRQRLHDGVLGEYEEFFERQGVRASYDETFSAFEVAINLNRVALSPTQARFLSTAMSLFRAEHS